MAENQIEIEVTLDAKQAKKGLDDLESAGSAVGESFSTMGKAVVASGTELGEVMGGIGETASGTVDAFMDLADASRETGVTFGALLGPIGAVALAVFELIQAFREYSNEVDGTAIRIEAYQASLSDITSIVEELAAAQVELTDNELETLKVKSQQAQQLLNEAELLRERNKQRYNEIAILEEEYKLIEAGEDARSKAMRAMGLESDNRLRLIGILARENEIRAKVAPIEEKAFEKIKEGGRITGEVERMKEEILKRSLQVREEIAAKEAELVAQAQLQVLSLEATTLEGQRKLLDAQFMQRLGKLNEMLKEDKVTREGYRKILEGMTAEHEAKVIKIEETNRQKKLASFRAYQAKRLAAERQLAAEQARIRQLEIDRMRLDGATEIEVLEAQYDEQAKLAGKNQNLLLIAQMNFENQRLKLEKDAERKRQEAASQAARDEADRAKQRQEFIFNSMEFDLNLLSDGIDKELKLLELRYEKELRLRSHSEEEITELARRHSIERERLIEAPIHMAIEQTKEMAKSFSDGFAIATYNAVLFGDSFKESIGEVLVGLGRQASVEALMELAKGTAALFLNPVLAANHFKAAGVFTVAAAAAGQAGKGLGGGSIATPPTPSAAAGGGSPTGSPQTATPERATADTSPMVFNINFGNSTIYDTKRAATDAFTDQVIRTMSRRRRGAPQLPFRG